MFSGSFVALVTPFNQQGDIDEDQYVSLIKWHIDKGTHGLVPCGTTGETPTLKLEEHKRLIELCVKEVKGQVPVIAGVGSNATDKVIDLAQYAEAQGADAVLVVTPYYNKPSQDGLYEHYNALHSATNIPIVLYNVPSRTGVDLSIETIGKLAELPRIVGIKDASPDLSRPVLIRQVISRKDFCLLSGEDGTVAAYLAQGGDGCISVTANVAPDLCAMLHDAWNNKDYAEFSELRDRLMPLHQVMFIEASPAPAKYALSTLGLCSPHVRLPLLEASGMCRKRVDSTMSVVGI